MTKEEKKLLLIDLCGRLPFNVLVECSINSGESIDLFLTTSHIDELINDSLIIKPYLRPMSSMTEEERIEFTKLFYKWHDDELFDYIEEGTEFSIWKHKGISPVVFDWLNQKMFDYRGLIEKGLALEAQEGMYDIKEK